MEIINRALRDKIAVIAQHRCEYCQTAQFISGAQMNIDHIIPVSRGGPSSEDNLCFACIWCNSFKWVKTHARDPETGSEIALFNPRTQSWSDHFYWDEDGVHIIGRTPIGRATIAALQMNNDYIITARKYWVEAGWHPPEI